MIIHIMIFALIMVRRQIGIIRKLSVKNAIVFFRFKGRIGCKEMLQLLPVLRTGNRLE